VGLGGQECCKGGGDTKEHAMVDDVSIDGASCEVLVVVGEMDNSISGFTCYFVRTLWFFVNANSF
jgi:hypothetical protein